MARDNSVPTECDGAMEKVCSIGNLCLTGT